MRVGQALLLSIAFAVGCGSTPAYQPYDPPTGTRVIVIRPGPDRVPFRPKVDRIRRANEQLAKILGHSIQIELDGALMPQDHDGAEDVIAALVEAIAKDLAELKQSEPKALADANANFDRLVVRYSPVEAEERGKHSARLDKARRRSTSSCPKRVGMRSNAARSNARSSPTRTRTKGSATKTCFRMRCPQKSTVPGSSFGAPTIRDKTRRP